MGTFMEAFRSQAGADETLRFDRFVDLALYHPVFGYYRRERPRVGKGPGTDFYTAASSGAIFGEIMLASVRHLLAGEDLTEYDFVEIGAENPEGILQGVEHPFRAVRVVRLGEPFSGAERCVVFSNELFDAQPFRRFRVRGRVWRELGVRAGPTGLEETEMPAGVLPDFLPPPSAEGYCLDAPTDAAALAAKLAAAEWKGLFIACDYGKTWQELAYGTPLGTARAYRHHRQSNDLLAHPGDQDLTCHICWDWLSQALQAEGFALPSVQAQEAFLVHCAGSYIETISRAEASRFSAKKLALLQLLHPSHLGRKFQILHARR
jgi:SAM-dependent MidA family methyltransferase